MSRFTTRYASQKTITLATLAFVWCLGLSSGFWLWTPQGSEHWDAFQSFCLRDITIAGSLITSLIPVILSALIFRYAVPYLILPIVLAESIVMGYCHSLVLWRFGHAGWLIIVLFGLSRYISNILLIDYWISNIGKAGEWDVLRLKRVIVICFLVSVLEHYLIHPFGIELISKL